MTYSCPRAAWRFTLDGWIFGWRSIRAMPVLALTTLIVSLWIEAGDTFCGKPGGVMLTGDAVPLLWQSLRAPLKICLAASTEIAVYGFVLLGLAADRPVWCTPARFRRYVTYGLLLGGAFAVLLNALPYVMALRSPAVTAALCLAFAGLAVTVLVRSMALFRMIVAQGRTETIGWREIAPHWWCLLRVLLLHMAVAIALSSLFGMGGSALADWGLENGRGLARHAANVFQALAGPYSFAASFSLLYGALAGIRRPEPVRQNAVLTGPFPARAATS